MILYSHDDVVGREGGREERRKRRNKLHERRRLSASPAHFFLFLPFLPIAAFAFFLHSGPSIDTRDRGKKVNKEATRHINTQTKNLQPTGQ